MHMMILCVAEPRACCRCASERRVGWCVQEAALSPAGSQQLSEPGGLLGHAGHLRRGAVCDGRIYGHPVLGHGFGVRHRVRVGQGKRRAGGQLYFQPGHIQGERARTVLSDVGARSRIASAVACVLSGFWFDRVCVRAQAFYLPWAYVALAILMGQSPVVHLMGIAAGHLYVFLDKIVPVQYNRTIVWTPAFLCDTCPPSCLPSTPPCLTALTHTNCMGSPQPQRVRHAAARGSTSRCCSPDLVCFRPYQPCDRCVRRVAVLCTAPPCVLWWAMSLT